MEGIQRAALLLQEALALLAVDPVAVAAVSAEGGADRLRRCRRCSD
jgi:hypothetical protein